eukprot:scpid77584/ scgid6030/ Bifunctional ATP-dependent dihydroxyacetone kinase/FAD-AMP lyase (cyclizing); ATP-dependent dihydroxyacetone kinase; Glycerone kinase; FAD-AMP lyase (cyclizing); FAD-AMP lyase (cyclic FMN forming); FMN cyclase
MTVALLLTQSLHFAAVSQAVQVCTTCLLPSILPCPVAEQICGAMAEQGKSLDEVYATAQRITQCTATIGVSLSPCRVPGRGASFQLPDGIMELGLGIHGEAGLQRTKVVSADETVAMMAERLFKQNMFAAGDHVALIVNNLGGLSNLELGVVSKAAIDHLEGVRKLHVDRVACGALMTSINMAGVSLSLLRLDDTLSDGLGFEVRVACWPSTAFQKRVVQPPVVVKLHCTVQASTTSDHGEYDEDGKKTGLYFTQCMRSVCEKLLDAEEELNDLDSAAGDGDCGSTFKQGALALLEMLDSNAVPVQRPHDALVVIAAKLEEVMGGTSGALYTLMLVRVAHILKQSGTGGIVRTCRECVTGMIDVISSYGGAKRGDRTMLDALCGAQDVLNKADDSATQSQPRSSSDAVEALTVAVQASRAGAEATASMKARAGRASYVSSAHWTRPDAGATAVAIWMSALLGSLTELASQTPAA